MPSTPMKPRVNSVERISNCSFCLLHKTRLCSAVTKMGGSEADLYPTMPKIEVSKHTISARQMIHHPKEFSEYVLFICSGQAVSSIGLADGRRQILSILLPGDVVFWTALFEPMSGRLVEAIQDSTYRRVRRDQFHAVLFGFPDLFEIFIEACSQEKAQADQIALSLGRRSAAERIARLILNLMERLTERDLMNGQTMEFHLRLRHIADATGLTPVHASKVLSQLQRTGIIELQKRSLTITDVAELRQVAGP